MHVRAESDNQQRPSAPIVHVRADSDTLLDQMFVIATKPPGSEMPLGQRPLRMRNLPASFWKPPNGGTKSPSCHSRENSHDSNSMADPYSPMPVNVGSPQPGPQQQQQQQPNQPQPPPSHSASVSHSRTHSAPPTLQQTLAVALPVQPQQQLQQQQQQQQLQQHAHRRQASFDIANPHMGGPLPPGWEETRTAEGQLYYMNHITKTTQWEDPRAQIMQQRNIEQQQIQPSQQQMESARLGPLPPGWEQGETQEGEIYFINHHEKKTSWFDPRVPIDSQRVPHRISQSQGGGQPQNPAALMAARKEDEAARRRMQELQAQRRQIAHRQAELKMLQAQQKLQLQRGGGDVGQLQQAQEMLMRHSLNDPNVGGPTVGFNDPILTTAQQQQQQADLHNRQESADSGLGMGSSFNLGSIPEDISGMESMDTGDLDTTLTGDSTPTAGTNSIGDDHLMTTIPVDLGDDVSNDLINSLMGSNRQTTNNQGSNPEMWL